MSATHKCLVPRAHHLRRLRLLLNVVYPGQRRGPFSSEMPSPSLAPLPWHLGFRLLSQTACLQTRTPKPSSHNLLCQSFHSSLLHLCIFLDWIFTLDLVVYLSLRDQLRSEGICSQRRLCDPFESFRRLDLDALRIWRVVHGFTSFLPSYRRCTFKEKWCWRISVFMLFLLSSECLVGLYLHALTMKLVLCR